MSAARRREPLVAREAAGALVVAFAAFAALASPASAAERILRADVVVPAPVSEVWAAWTTPEGIATFFAPKGKVELRVDGTYDVWFLPDQKPGMRGAEGMRILDVEREKRFAFTWNAPVSFPDMCNRRTVVILDFAPDGANATKLRFTQTGWGEGREWDEVYTYFDQAWGQIVLPFLVHRFEHGPVDWKKLPERQAKWPTLKRTLTATES